MGEQNPAPGSGENYIPGSEEKPQTKTQKENSPEQPIINKTPEPGVLTFTPEQFEALVTRLTAGQTTSTAPNPSLGGLQTNPFGQVVGTVTKFNVDPNYYPSPVERLLAYCEQDRRLSRHNVRENYYLAWDITAKPYPTKDNLMIQEPTFHLTLYANEYDRDGEETNRFIVIQTLQMNEDEELCRMFAAEQDPPIQVSDATLRKLMDETRYERCRRWLESVFFPPHNFDLNKQEAEEAIGGTVVKVITKSNVKGFGNPVPKVTDEELGVA